MNKTPEERLQEALDNIPHEILYGHTQTDRGSEDTIEIYAGNYYITIFQLDGFNAGVWRDENTCIWRNSEDVAYPWGTEGNMHNPYQPELLTDELVDKLIKSINDYIKYVGECLIREADPNKQQPLYKWYNDDYGRVDDCPYGRSTFVCNGFDKHNNKPVDIYFRSPDSTMGMCDIGLVIVYSDEPGDYAGTYYGRVAAEKFFEFMPDVKEWNKEHGL